jgi:signal transduction histidine kinase/CheY-like chemotaxis protein
MGAPPEPDFDELTRLAAFMCQTPVAFICLVGRNHQWFKSAFGIDYPGEDCHLPFCYYAIRQTEPLIVPDAAQDVRFNNHPWVALEPGLRFFAGAPLITSEGYSVGALCVMDRDPKTLDSARIGALQSLARQTVVNLEARRLNIEAARAILEKQDETAVSGDAGVYRAAFRQNRIPSILVDAASGEIVDANVQARELFGYPVGDWKRMAAESVSKITREADVNASGEDLSAFPFLSLPIANLTGAIRDVEVYLSAVNSESRSYHHLELHDVTDRKRMEEELHNVLNHARCILWTADVRRHQDRFHWWQRVSDLEAAHRVLPLNIQPGEQYAEAWYHHRHPEDKDRMSRISEEALESGKTSYSQEYRCFNKFGELRWLNEDVSLYPVGEEAWRAVGVCTDITESKRSEERLRSVMTKARCILWHGEIQKSGERYDWRIVISDEAAAQRILPLTVPSGETYADAFDRSILAQDRPSIVTTVHSAIASGQPSYRHEFRVADNRGNAHWLFEDVYLEPIQKGRWRAVGVCIDVTDQKRSEEERARSIRAQAARKEAQAAERRSSFLAEVSKTLSGSLDYERTLEEVVRLAVPSLADWCIIDLVEEEGFRRLAVAHADPSQATLAERLKGSYVLLEAAPFGVSKVIRTGRTEFVSHFDRTVLDRITQGEKHRAALIEMGIRSYVCVPLINRSRLLGALSFTACDPERVYREEDVQLFEEVAARAAIAIDNARLYNEVVRADHAKDEFLTMLAHELRNPLSPILNSLHLLSLKCDEKTATERGILERQVRHMARLIDNLLDVSRIDRGKIQLDPEPTDFRRLIEEVAEDYDRHVRQAGISLELDLPGEPLWVNGDAIRLSQAMTNLLHNAVKFTDPGGAIRIRAEADDATRQAKVTVQDSGIGIEPQLLARLFEPFIQADVSLERSRGGLGLGLALVKGLIEMHGGSVSAKSDGLGKGSEFLLRLPLLRTPEIQPEAARIPASKTATSLRILIIEDNVDSANALRDVLELSGHAVDVAYSGTAGLEAARRLQPDVILCDVGLPGMDGYSIARELRGDSKFARTHLIAITGYGQEKDRALASEAGFERHLIKPVPPEEMSRLLSDYQTRPRTGGEAE